MNARLTASLLALLLLTSPSFAAGILDTSWSPPTTNTDGTPLTDLASFRLYYDVSPLPCPRVGSVSIPSTTLAPQPGDVATWRLTGLTAGSVYYVQVTAVDTAGQESACSVMASAAARSDVPTSDTTPPTIVIQSARVVNKQALLSGIAGDNVGVVSVKWVDSRGGSGTATGTTNWSFTTPIRPGNTVYTITARDAAGNFKNVSVTLKGN